MAILSVETFAWHLSAREVKFFTCPSGPDRELQQVEIVGVTAGARVYDVKDTNLYAAYLPSLQRGSAANGKAIVIRGPVTTREVNRAVESLGREYVADMTSLSDILDETFAARTADGRGRWI